MGQVVGHVGFAPARGDAHRQARFPGPPRPVPVTQGPVQESLHLRGHVPEVHRRSQYHRVRVQKFFHHSFVVVPDPARALLNTHPAAATVFDLLLAQKDFFQSESLPRQMLFQHGEHLRGVAKTLMGRAIEGHYLIFVRHPAFLLLIDPGIFIFPHGPAGP